MLSYLDLHEWMVISPTFSVHFSKFPLFLSNKEGNKWIIYETSGFHGIFQISPKDLPTAKLTHTKDELFNPS